MTLPLSWFHTIAESTASFPITSMHRGRHYPTHIARNLQNTFRELFFATGILV